MWSNLRFIKKQNKILLKENEKLRREIERRHREKLQTEETQAPEHPKSATNRSKIAKIAKKNIVKDENEEKSLEDEIVEEYEQQILDVKKTLMKERKEKRGLIDRLKVS